MTSSDSQIEQLKIDIAKKNKEIELLTAVLKEIRKLQEQASVNLDSDRLSALEEELNNL